MTETSTPAAHVDHLSDGIAFIVIASLPRNRVQVGRGWTAVRAIVLADSEHDARARYLAAFPHARGVTATHPES